MRSSNENIMGGIQIKYPNLLKLGDTIEICAPSCGVPVIYDADIGHIPPQMQIINGAIGNVVYDNGNVTVTQEMI